MHTCYWQSLGVIAFTVYRSPGLFVCCMSFLFEVKSMLSSANAVGPHDANSSSTSITVAVILVVTDWHRMIAQTMKLLIRNQSLITFWFLQNEGSSFSNNFHGRGTSLCQCLRIPNAQGTGKRNVKKRRINISAFVVGWRMLMPAASATVHFTVWQEILGQPEMDSESRWCKVQEHSYCHNTYVINCRQYTNPW
jgi:hypothetical protein